MGKLASVYATARQAHWASFQRQHYSAATVQAGHAAVPTLALPRLHGVDFQGFSVGSLVQGAPAGAKECAAFAVASAVFPPFLNWAENAKSVAQHHRRDPRFATIQGAVQQIVRARGVSRLATAGMGTSVMREVVYTTSRWMLYTHFRRDDWSLTQRSAGSFLSGVLGSLLSSPLDYLRVRQQSASMQPKPRSGAQEYRGVIEGARRRGLRVPHLALWSGWQVNCLRAGMFTAGSITAYEATKSALKANGVAEGTAMHVVAGVCMGVVGVTLYMPADAVRGRCYNLSPNKPLATRAILRTARQLYAQAGVRGFYKGTSMAMVRSVPACVAFPVLMEKARHMLGLGYL